MGRLTPHSSTHPGKRVRVVLRDGSEAEGKFIERTAKFVVLDVGKYRMRDIDQFIIVKQPRAVRGPKDT